ncbi:MAG: hypothetical protein R6V15_05905 [Desulfotignum sp.]
MDKNFQDHLFWDTIPDPPPKKRKTSLRLTGQADRMFLDKKTIINEVQPI